MNSPEETVEGSTIQPTEGSGSADPDDSEERRAATGPSHGLFARLGAHRAAILGGLAGVLILVLGGTAARLMFPSPPSDTPGRPADPLFASVRDAGAPDRLVEQELAPFYVPLPPGKDGQMARVSLCVTWDRPSSSRFRSLETRVRDRLYLRLTELAAEGEHMRGMSLTVRTEARKILEELLRPEELRVVVTGIFIV